MIHIYVKLFMFITFVSGAAVVGASTLGQFHATNPVLDGIYQGCENLPQPCWYGILPGETPLENALENISKTGYIKMMRNNYVITLVYRTANIRCGVELRTKAGIIDTVTIINCFDQQIGDVVKAMHNSNHKLPFSMGMLDAMMTEEITDSYEDYLPCLAYTPYGQIIGMPLGVSGEPIATRAADWNDFLPYGWYVHNGGSLTCDTFDSSMNFS